MGSKKEKNQVDIAEWLLKEGQKLSSGELGEVIARLSSARQNALHREEILKRQREKKEAEERAKKEAEKERIEKTVENSTSMELPLDYENIFSGDARAADVRAESISDGLILSLTNLGKVDIEYIALITGETHKKIIETLKGAIYQNPDKWGECFYKGWETAEEYLSGNLVAKFQAAQSANAKYKGLFKENIEAISKIIPPSLCEKDIFITLGSPWVPADIIEDFIRDLFRKEGVRNVYDVSVLHDELTGTWDIPNKSLHKYDPRSYSTLGTKRIYALNIIEKTLNMKNVAVYDKVISKTNKSGEKSVLNKAETTLALERQKELIARFKKWVWQDETRKERLISIFDEKFSCYKKRRFDGSFLTFPNMDNGVKLYDYQKDAVARILFTQNVLLAHDVGSGKTYEMIAGGMELKRMGISEKNMYVVPNNIVGQWMKILLTMYPNAKLKVVEPKDFSPQKRENVLLDIKYKDYDGIIMAYSCFELIPLSNNFYAEQLEKQSKVLEEYEKNSRKNTSGIQREKKKIQDKLKDLADRRIKSKCLTSFDELGVTRLFIDEAHNFKNVPIQTKIDKVLGITSAGSRKCAEMLDKVRCVQKKGGVIMATGTPITNSVTDAYVMQLYLQYGELCLLDLQSFDAWVGMFAERKAEFEVDVDTSCYRLATRFSKFHNLPELTSLLSSFADFHNTKKSEELPQFNGYKDCLLAKTQDFADYLKVISIRAEAVRKGQVDRKTDNMLLITTDGRKAALDLRLVDKSKGSMVDSKVFRCAENVYHIYIAGNESKLTQLVFCDNSTPKNGFNIYDELKNLLVYFGVKPDEIAYIHDAVSDKKRSELFGKMRKGEIRILIGSTFKLGLGVNVQDKLIAIHHLDIPWRPADMVQREGRIIRPGNTNKEIFIYRYITEGSFDAYSWQLLETKQNFIASLLSGSYEERDGKDIEDTVLSYAEVKALAIGNPLIKERVETANELTRLKQLQIKTVEMKESLNRELSTLPKEIEDQKDRIEKCREDALFYKAEKERQSIKRERENEGKDAKTIAKNKAEKNSAFNAKVYGEVLKNTLKNQERYLTDYCGFQIVLPANMLPEKPYLYMVRQGRYYVELGDTEKGVTVRLYNFLEGLPERLKKLKEKLSEMQDREKYINEELKKDTDYSETIASVKDKLQQIDKNLGVKK